MQHDDCKRLREEWGDKPCDHPKLEKNITQVLIQWITFVQLVVVNLQGKKEMKY